MGHRRQGADRRGDGWFGRRRRQWSRARQRELFLRRTRLLPATRTALQLHLLPRARAAGGLLPAARRGLSYAGSGLSGTQSGLLPQLSWLLVKFGEPGNAGPPDEISGGLLFSLNGSGVSADRRFCCLEKNPAFCRKPLH